MLIVLLLPPISKRALFICCTLQMRRTAEKYKNPIKIHNKSILTAIGAWEERLGSHIARRQRNCNLTAWKK